MKQQLLLLKDVDSLGKKGEIVTAKPGYFRNFLLPKGYAVVASQHTLRKQENLRKEREQQAIVDRKESEELAIQLEGKTFQISVKVDPEGHMYGSVSAGDILKLFEEQGLPVEKKAIPVTKPIKETGIHKLKLQLKEGVVAVCELDIVAENLSERQMMEDRAPAAEPVADKEVTEEPKTDESSDA